jgi:hypothetical protein
MDRSELERPSARRPWASWASWAGYAAVLVGVGGVAWATSHLAFEGNDAPPAPPDPVTHTLRDDTEVIGVSVDGRHRAYVLDALRPAAQHVYNDLLGDTPVTVTYCDLAECVRVFTGPERKRRLELAVGGSHPSGQRRMVLWFRAGLYEQETGQLVRGTTAGRLPLDELKYLRTTWGEWKRRHPDTDVYPPTNG